MPGETSSSRRRPPRRRVWSTFAATVLCCAALVFGSGVLAAGKPIVSTARTLPPSGTGADPASNPNGVEIAASLQRELRAGATRDFAIELRERADLSAAFSMDWIERGRYVYEHLHATAERSQSGLRAMLDRRGVRYRSFWIKNAIVVEQGDLATLQASALFNEVARIREAPRLRMARSDSSAAKSVALEDVDGIASNIAHVGADRVWAGGITGDGVTVGLIDEGAFHTHEALQRQYRGNLGGGRVEHDYNWFGPSGHPDTPIAEGARGIRALGTILGDNGAADPAQRKRIGMAPNAKWIACYGLFMDGGTEFALPECGQFMLAPTKTDGSAPDPDRRPQVVNNSWNYQSCNGDNGFFREIVENWVAAGIFPVFAAGDAASCSLPEPAGLSTVWSPASLGAAFAVGSSGNHDGLYARHSLWGPSTASSAGLPHYPDPRGWPTLKPQVIAPGMDIVSAADGLDAYSAINGTAMAAPHISGLVALMLEAGDCLRGDYATLGTLIMQTARPIDYDTGGSPPPGPGNVPNYAAGWGEIDAPAAVEAAAQACGPHGIVRGTVSDANGQPLAGAKVEVFADENVRIHQRTTERDGSYVWSLPVNASGYTIRVTKYGYLPYRENGMLVQNGATIVRDVPLAMAPTYKVSGRVTDATTGWPLHAKVVIGGYPGEPIWTDPASGRYSIRLAEGVHYRFDVDSDIPGYKTQTREVDSIAGGTQDFALDADRVACSAPGYAYATTRLSEGFENNGSAPPSGWTRSSNGIGWIFGGQADVTTSYFYVTEHGRFAAANDQLGANNGLDNDGSVDYLLTPPLNLLGLTEPVLSYQSFFYPSGVLARAEASIDGGAHWVALGVPKIVADREPWTREAVSLREVVSANTRIRFHADDGTVPGDPHRLAAGWAIDDVVVAANCIAPTGGGLVFGHVRDANDGRALDGAVVSVEGGLLTTTTTSADPALGAGFYAVHAAAGTRTVSARRGTQPAGYGDASATPNVVNAANTLAELALPAGRLRVYPTQIAAEVELGTTKNVALQIGNTGTRPLQYGFEQAAIEEHFEGGFPPPGWTTQTLSGGCHWGPVDFDQIYNYAGGDGNAAAINPRLCAEGGDVDAVLTSPPLDLSASQTASIGFFLSLYEGPDSWPRFDVEVSADGGGSWTSVYSETRENNGGGPGALIETDISAFVGSSDVRVRFHYKATPPWSWAVIDQVHLFNTVNSSPILDLAPDAGALAAGESRNLQATFDARAIAQPGVYDVDIQMITDTPYYWALGDVVAKMTVTAPASWGVLAGSVRGLGYCEADPHALGDATIKIVDRNGTVHATKSARDGSYSYWLDAARGPFTLTVSAADHLDASGEFAVTAGAQASADFGLRPLRACVVTDPANVSAQVESGKSTQRSFDLMNTGAAAADWTLSVGGDPSIKTLVPWIQTSSRRLDESGGFACHGAFTTQNSWMRKFDLAERNAPGEEVLLTRVNFGADLASSLQGTQTISIRVHELVGELVFANLRLLGEKSLQVGAMQQQPLSVSFDPPLVARGDSVLVVEIRSPDGVATGSNFYPGGNEAEESAPAYWASPDCGYDEPVTFAEAHFTWLRLVLDIETKASDPCGAGATPVNWLALSAAGGNIAADATVPLQATFNAGGRADGSYRGAMCLTPGRGSSYPRVVPTTLRVGQGGDAIFADGFDGS